MPLDVSEGAPYALRFKCDPQAKKFALSLEKEAFGNVVVNLLVGKYQRSSISAMLTGIIMEYCNAVDVSAQWLDDAALYIDEIFYNIRAIEGSIFGKSDEITALERTFVVNGQPHFVKFSIDPTFKITIERISTPLHFYMTTTTPIVVQNGIDDQTFGIIESRGGSVFLGVRKDAMPGYQKPGDCTFNPTDPELNACSFSQFYNIYGGAYAPKGKLLIAAREAISNGHGIETELTTTFISKTLNVSKSHTHKFYTGGNGSFMRSLSGMMLNSKYISNLYNDFEVYGGDIILQGPPGSTVRITGNVKTPTNMWVMTGQYDLRQEREDIITPPSYIVGGSAKIGEISLSHNYPRITMGWDHYLRCDTVHVNHPSGGWQPYIVKVGDGHPEYSSNYGMTGAMSIRVHTGAVYCRNLDVSTSYIQVDQ